MPYAVAAACINVADKTCLAERLVDCTYAGGRMLYNSPGECIECGACRPARPLDATARIAVPLTRVAA